MQRYLILPHDSQRLSSKTLGFFYNVVASPFKENCFQFTAANYFTPPRQCPPLPDLKSQGLTTRRFSIEAAGHLPLCYIPSLILRNWSLQLSRNSNFYFGENFIKEPLMASFITI